MQKTNFIKHIETSPKSPLGIGFEKCSKNPDIINLGTAENRLMNDWLLPKLKDWSDFTPASMLYSAGQLPQLNSDIASLYRDHFGIKDAKPENIIPSVGVAFLVQCIGYVLCDPGDIVLIPKPCYGCFEQDIYPCKCKVEYIDLNNLPPSPPEKSRLLILTNPGNPYGDIIPDQDKLIKWALSNPNLHIVTDDIYALSNRRGEPYISIAGRSDIDPMRVHQFYGISKDWGLAGFHVSFFFTRNMEMMQLMKEAAGTTFISSDTLYSTAKLFKDHKWRDEFIIESRKRLQMNEEFAVKLLREANIPVREADNSLFFMIDLTEFVKTEEEEMKLYVQLADEYKVHILPGKAGFFCDTPGWFRLCFSTQHELLEEGLKRLIRAVQDIRKK